jgi:alpha/beta superfamily hydrolase
VGSEILRQGLILVTFNFRYVNFLKESYFEPLSICSGAGKSQGRTSWTGRPEIADYVSITGFLIQYLNHLRQRTHEGPEATKGEGKSRRIQLVLGGYSYGSLIASYLPDIPSILVPFLSHTPTDAAHRITRIAQELSSVTKNTLDPTPDIPGGQGPASPGDAVEESNVVKDGPSLSEFSIDVSYLLVSPLLPPVSVLISLPIGNNLINDMSMTKFKAKPTLAIWGTNDIFTSAKKLRRWAEEHHQLNQRFVWIEVQGASHFWQETGVVDKLTSKIGEFITLNSKAFA